MLFPLSLLSQNDTIVAQNGDMLVGKVKGIASGIVTMKTMYSNKDFLIDYEDVKRLSLEYECLVLLDGGRRISGYLRSEEDNRVSIFSTEGTVRDLNLDNIAFVDIIRESIWNRFRAYVDIGFNLTRSNNNRQFNVNGGVAYTDLKWLMNTTISSLISARNDVEPTERTSVDADLQRVLSTKWFLTGSLAFLSISEQALRGRYSARLGAGRFLASTNHLYLGVSTGLNLNIENYEDEQKPDQESTELFVSAWLRIFESKGFNLNTTLNFFPSLTRADRIRVDYLLDIKYDLPLDFYVKLGFQFNYDNQPPQFASEFDYILNTGVGWKFN